MSKQPGTAVLVKVGDGGSPENFTTLKGQRTASFDGSADQIDVSDKTQMGWRSFIPGLLNASISCDGVADFPDTLGLKALQTAWASRQTINLELVINTAGDKFEGSYYVTQFQINGDYDGAVEYSLQFSPAAAVVFTEVAP